MVQISDNNLCVINRRPSHWSRKRDAERGKNGASENILKHHETNSFPKSVVFKGKPWRVQQNEFFVNFHTTLNSHFYYFKNIFITKQLWREKKVWKVTAKEKFFKKTQKWDQRGLTRNEHSIEFIESHEKVWWWFYAKHFYRSKEFKQNSIFFPKHLHFIV